ncbi:MAG: hypothetical protein AB3K77_00060 [Methanosarcinaceae archaeon]
MKTRKYFAALLCLTVLMYPHASRIPCEARAMNRGNAKNRYLEFFASRKSVSRIKGTKKPKTSKAP